MNLLKLAVALALGAATGFAAAQGYPTRPIRMVEDFTPVSLIASAD